MSEVAMAGCETGRLAGIARRAKPFAEMEVLTSARITKDAGLEGDFRGRDPERTITVLAKADWQAACGEIEKDLPWTARRANLLVEGLGLPRARGARLRIGGALLEVVEECAPCARMEAQSERLRRALAPEWRGGVACRVIEGGAVETGSAAGACPAPPVEAGQVLDFWFKKAGPDKWFGGGPAFDAQVAARLGALSERAPTDLMDWQAEALSGLALIVLLDQVPRQLHRGEARAFALDPLARCATETGLAAGALRFFNRFERVMFLMPFEHAEDLALQERVVDLLESGKTEGPDDQFLIHAKAHRDLIRRFGRFPHRNAVLGRQETQAERQFREGGGYNPG